MGDLSQIISLIYLECEQGRPEDVEAHVQNTKWGLLS
jgi:hypothetical protein